jgi:hypothetical protein
MLAMLAGCPPFFLNFGSYHELPQMDGGGTGGTGTTGTGTGGAPLCTQGMTQPCYEGPAGTEGVGICMGGTQTCAADGEIWGPCVGEVTPQTETCGSGLDQNCDGMVAPSCAPMLLWAKEFGGANSASPVAIATDPLGNVLVVGDFGGTIDFGCGPLVSASGPEDVFVAKLRPDSTCLWAKPFGSTGTTIYVASIVSDSLENTIVTGRFSGAIDFGCGSTNSTGSAGDAYVAKLDQSGNCMWANSFGTSGNIAATKSVAVDSTGDTIVTGTFSGTMNFGCSQLTSVGTPGDMFIAELGADGGCIWANRFGTMGALTLPTSLAVDNSGDVIITGSVSGTTDFGCGDSAGSLGAIFIADLGTSGQCLWSHTFGGMGTTIPAASVAVDSAGASYLTGGFVGSVDFGGGSLGAAGVDNLFVAKFDGGGNYAWAKSFGDSAGGSFAAAGIAVNNAAEPWVVGSFSGSVDFGGGPLAVAGTDDVFVAKLDASGSYLWAQQFGGDGFDGGGGVALDSAGDAYIIGEFTGLIDLGAPPLMAAANASSDVFVAKFSP